MNYKLLIIGVGGTGANLAAMLSRFVNNQWEIILMDADRVEEHNLERQAFQEHDINEFKAEAMSRKINTATSANSTFKNKYLKKVEDLNFLNKSNEIAIIGCVDNHPARMLIERWWKKNRKNFQRAIYIDSANELNYGEVISRPYKRSYYNNGEDEFDNYKLRSDIYPKIKRDKKGDVNNKSCAVNISNGDDQQYATNLQAAIICFKVFKNFLNEEKIPNQIHFDLESWGMKSV